MKAGESVQTTARIQRFRFKSDDESFAIVSAVSKRRQEFTMVGALGAFKVDDEVLVSGTWVESKYGMQLRVSSCEIALPSTNSGIARFLTSQLTGVGPRMAQRIIDCFGDATIDVLDRNPDRLLEVRGISSKRLESIKEEWSKSQTTRQVFVYLQGHGLSYDLSAKLIAIYGVKVIPILKEQPYTLAKEVSGIGFKRADLIAKNMGFPENSPLRIEAGIDYALYEAESNAGHCYLPLPRLVAAASNLLGLPREAVLEQMDLLVNKKSIRTELDDAGELLVYRSHMWNLEHAVARQLLRVLRAVKHKAPSTATLAQTEVRLGLELGASQRKAVLMGMREKVMVITGGPGTGKTTLVKVFVSLANDQGLDIFLAAPTGRAAKRLCETTMHEAKTIHRLLEYSFVDEQRGVFMRNKENPLEEGIYIIDEASMLDLSLMRSLLSAMPDAAQILFVGDVDQLPSVGSGTVLKDLIASGHIPMVRLDLVFRQAEQSLIVKNAHRINEGLYPLVPSKEEMANVGCEFFLFEASTPQHAESLIERLVCEKIPKRFNLDPHNDIQVLCPMRQNPGGVEHLNSILQARLNTEGTPIPHRYTAFRVGDRVMQLKNDYDRDVYNGDIGTIISHQRQTTVVDFDGRTVEYKQQQLDMLTLAYACTVHKSQGSEYPAVICVFLRGQSFMLQRNLIYTALTRARRLAIFITDERTLTTAIANNRPAERFTQLSRRIAEAAEVDDA